jgi:two-component system alkaline phosphatase synthesis response regulator PhoP
MNSPLALIVEDDYDSSVIFEGALKAAGFDTEVIRSGDEALERLTTVTPELVVLDLHLPGVSGLSILEQMRKDAHLASTQVIIITGDTVLADTSPLLKGAVQILVKPVTFTQLRDLARFLRLLKRSPR